LKSTDDNFNKFSLYNLLNSNTPLRQNLEYYMDFSRGGIEVKFNGKTDYRLVGQFPGQSQLRPGYSDEEIKEVYNTLLSLVNNDTTKIFGLQQPKSNTRCLGLDELTGATPLEILSKYIDTDLPFELQQDIYNAQWIWDPSFKDGPRLILHGTRIDDVDRQKAVYAAVEASLSRKGISVVHYDNDDPSHIIAEQNEALATSARLKIANFE
jgi:hypothetical protein